MPNGENCVFYIRHPASFTQGYLFEHVLALLAGRGRGNFPRVPSRDAARHALGPMCRDPTM